METKPNSTKSGWKDIDIVWATRIICDFCDLAGIDWRFGNFFVHISANGTIDIAYDNVTFGRNNG